MSHRKQKDPAWCHFFTSNEGKKVIGTCSYCRSARYVNNICRMKEHLGKCLSSPDSVRRQYEGFDSQSGKSRDSKTNSQRLNSSLNSSIVQEENSVGLEVDPTDEELTSVVQSSSSDKSNKQERLDNCVDNISQRESAAMDQALARYVFAEGLPFSIVESPHFRDFISLLRPSYVPPSRFQISNSLLEIENARVDAQKNEKIQSAADLFIFTDGWSGIDNRSLINFLVGCPKPVFLNSVDTGANAHTANFIASQICSVIEQLGSNRQLLPLSLIMLQT